MASTKQIPEAKRYVNAFTSKITLPKKPLTLDELKKRMTENKIDFKTDAQKLLKSVNKIDPDKFPIRKMQEDIQKSLANLKAPVKRFHGAKLALTWFPFHLIGTKCSNKFGYMSNSAVRSGSKLPFNITTTNLLTQLGNIMGDAGRPNIVSSIPAGYTYFGQFVDHDITLDISSTLDMSIDARTITNMRSPALDLDSVYGNGPGLDTYLYNMPTSEPLTAIKFALGTNTSVGVNRRDLFNTVFDPTNFDVPRIHNPINPAISSLIAVIGDPRNDENLIVSQFHHAMLKFHNKVVDMLVVSGFSGDIFTEAKRIVTHHYQWAVINDYLKNKICGNSAVDNALANIHVVIGSSFNMPVEFAVAAYRFGHSQIRDRYWINFSKTDSNLTEVFNAIRQPNIPVKADFAVNFNAFFHTGISVPVFNNAMKIDSVLAHGLEAIPGGSGIMAILATRNLRRGLAMGLPSGQAMASSFGLSPLTSTELTSGLPANEIAILNSNSGILLEKTPLWYYVLREAKVISDGEKLGPVGAKIVADTFVRMLKRDANSYLNVTGGFTPFLPSNIPNDFSVTDLIKFSGVCEP